MDTSTGTIKLKGTFQNKAHKLWPGQFVNVVLRLTMRNNAVVVPNQAVQTGQDGTYVYVVGEDRGVTVVPVKTGPRDGFMPDQAANLPSRSSNSDIIRRPGGWVVGLTVCWRGSAHPRRR